jgi:hypothetical protein
MPLAVTAAAVAASKQIEFATPQATHVLGGVGSTQTWELPL